MVILGSIVIAIVSGVIGKYIGGRNVILEPRCKERREACILLISEKIDALSKEVNDLKEALKTYKFV